jgi:hypothetical protein
MVGIDGFDVREREIAVGGEMKWYLSVARRRTQNVVT